MSDRNDAILVLNAGSSSIKFALFALDDGAPDGLALDCRGQVEAIGGAARFKAVDASGSLLGQRAWQPEEAPDHAAALMHLLAFLEAELADYHLAAVGHRVVHGGMSHSGPAGVDAGMLEALEACVPLAPLHQPHNLLPIRVLREKRPALPQVACFDTAFHRSNPPLAQRFALPERFFEAGVRRYGFHGLSYEYIASVLGDFDQRAAAGRTVVLHLGNGASMCALEAGRSIASTMSFTALDGLPMGTRCGDLDPGVMLWLMDEKNMDARALEALLYHQSGLLGVSGIASDMRTLLASEAAEAKLAVELYIYRINRELGSLAAALGGVDALVFTAGIGENAPRVRQGVMAGTAWLGGRIDEQANARGGPRVHAMDSRLAAWVIPTDEARMIARHTRRLLARD